METGLPVEAGVSLEDEEDNVRGPTHESQDDAAAQEEPVVVVVVDQTLQGVRDQSLALGDLVGQQDARSKPKSVFRGFAGILFQFSPQSLCN